MRRSILSCILGLILLTVPAFATTYHVASDGSGDFTTPTQANANGCSPGDTFAFRNGDAWYYPDQVIPCSGDITADVKYTSYGTGAKPRILGSIPLNSTSDWTNESGNVWYHAPDTAVTGSDVLSNPSFDSSTSPWYLYVASPAVAALTRTTTAGEFDSAPAGAKVTVTTTGGTSDKIQLWYPNMSLVAGKVYFLTYRAKVSSGTYNLTWTPAKATSPYTWYASNYTKRTATVTNSWQTFTILFRSNITTSTDNQLHANIGDMASGVTLYMDTFSIKELTNQKVFYGDVGQLVFDVESSVGSFKWNKVDMAVQGDFFYDSDTWNLFLYSASNPASYYIDIQTIWDSIYGTNGSGNMNAGVLLGGKQYVTVEKLDVRYWPGGIGGASVFNDTIIQDNDISYIGGASSEPNVRYGNGVLLQGVGSMQNITIRRNYIHDIWDSGISKENPSTLNNILIYDNVVFNTGLGGLEWIGAANNTGDNVQIVYNTFANAGGGIFGGATGRTQGWTGCIDITNDTGNITNFNVKYNILYNDVTFTETTSNYKARALFVGGETNPNFSKINMDYNIIFRRDASKELIYNYQGGGAGSYTMGTFSNYKSNTGKETNSLNSDPMFINSALNNFGLLSTSPAIDAGVCVTGITDDFFGISRPRGRSCDLGASEFPTRTTITNGTIYGTLN